MNTSDIIWEEPPPKQVSRRGPGKRGQWLAALHAHPGQWAMWPHPVASSSTDWFKERKCEVALRLIAGSDPKRYHLYARYMPPQDGAA